MRAQKTRNGNTWTEAQFWSAIRSALRAKFRWWVPAIKAKQLARRANQSDNPRLKWEYRCAKCGGWFQEKNTQIDHVIPCGSLKNYDDLEEFIKKMTPESSDSFQLLCKPCHKIKTKADRCIL